MKKLSLFVGIISLFFVAAAQGPCPDAATMKDYEGTEYKTVQIGKQCWMRENIRATHGKYIDRFVQGYANSTAPAFYYPDGDEKNAETYGLLYNYHAAQAVCPPDWHLPNYDEYETMMNFCQQYYESYKGDPKSAPTFFKEQLAGYYHFNVYHDFGKQIYLWSADYHKTDVYDNWYESAPIDSSDDSNHSKGLSVRCVKNVE